MWGVGVGGFIKEPNVHVREVIIYRSHSHIPPLTHSHLVAMTSPLLLLVACSLMSGVKSVHHCQQANYLLKEIDVTA